MLPRRAAGRTLLGFAVLLGVALSATRGQAQPNLAKQPGTLCIDAVRAAERRHGVPAGLLFAMSQVESGRPDPATHRVAPWPWTVQAEDKGLYFDSKDQAIQWVREAMTRGVSSIDTGCLQVNLSYHPRAFDTLNDAFDPRINADYAARFLMQLHAATGDWRIATGFYHSQTPALAVSYRERVEQTLAAMGVVGALPPASGISRPPTALDRLSEAWRATMQPAAAEPRSARNGWETLRAPPALRRAGGAG